MTVPLLYNLWVLLTMIGALVTLGLRSLRRRSDPAGNTKQVVAPAAEP